MNKDEIWFILLNISNENKISLIRKYKSESNIRKNKSNIDILNSIKINKINEERINEFENYIKDKGIGYITINSKEYPSDLHHLELHKPYVIFYKGNLELLKNKLVAVIGSRKCTSYGAEIAKILGNEISKHKYTVVSGLALGIDSIAQKSALKNEGRTIGVLGCGIDIIYPKSNKYLYEEILKNDGLIISEFLPGTAPYRHNFPLRNRIISGISKHLIVVEANNKSGSLITVDSALSLGRNIMAVPGPIINGNSEGCNKLIRDGAIPLTEMEDLYSFLQIDKKSIKNQNNTNKSILLDIINNEPKHLDDIIECVNVDRKVLFELLFEMQNANEIICLPGNYYAKSI